MKACMFMAAILTFSISYCWIRAIRRAHANKSIENMSNEERVMYLTLLSLNSKPSPRQRNFD
jgi:hypothetical protein